MTKKIIVAAVAAVICLSDSGGEYCFGQNAANANSAIIPLPAGTNRTADKFLDVNAADAELVELRKKNEQAQAEYFQKLSQKLDEKPPEKTFWERFTKSLAESPASTVGVLGAILVLIGALVAARITYLSFLSNYYAALRNQSDTQFFEALKRFGDKESSTARASAAGLLAVIGKSQIQILDKEKIKFFALLSSGQKFEEPYQELAYEQLLAGMMLEENATVLSAIQNAIRELLPQQKTAAVKLYQLNLEFQDKLVMTLAEYFGTGEIAQRNSITEPMLREVELLTGIQSAEINELIEKFEREFGQGTYAGKKTAPGFSARLKKNKEVAQNYSPEKKSEQLQSLAGDLRQAGLRLKFNAELLLEAAGHEADFGTKYTDVYLPSRRLPNDSI